MKLSRLLQNNYIPWLPYIIICLLLASPFLYGVTNLVFLNPLPNGFDNTVHAFFIKRMLETGDALISYTQFPISVQENDMYYPSFMHMILAAALAVSNQTDSPSVIYALNSFILVVSIIGSIGFSLLIKEILKTAMFKTFKINILNFGFGYFIYFNLLCVLVFGLVAFSTSLVLKTINDGTYSEVFAMWAILPFFLIFLVRHNWVKAGVLLAVIASTHNLSFLMTSSITVSYLLSLVINLDKKSLRKSIMLFISFGILALPAVLLFYLPTVQGVLNNTAGQVETISQDLIVIFLSPLLYYGAIVASVTLLVLNYRSFSWLSIWCLFYFILFSYLPLLIARVTREAGVAFSLIIGISIAYGIHFLLNSKFLSKPTKKPNLKIFKNNIFKILVVGLAVLIVLPLYYLYQYDRIEYESNQRSTFYYSDASGDSYKYLLSLNEKYIEQANRTSDLNSKETIAVYGYSPWLKVVLYDQYNVFEVLPKTSGDMLSFNDKIINNHLLHVIHYPFSIESACFLDKYNIDYLYISDDLEDRFYTPYQSFVFYKKLDLFKQISLSPSFDTLKEFHGANGELLKVYGVNKDYLNNNC